jgi:hypothetical protein
MLLLILDARNAIAGAKNGIELCLNVVIPTLFPFCVLSVLLRSSIAFESPSFLRPIEKLCSMPRGCGTIFLLGLLGGYPIGAICIEQAVKDKSMTYDEAKYLRAICNNAGPSFIIGMLSTIFNSIQLGYMLILIQALSAILTCMILSNKSSNSVYVKNNKRVKFSEAIKRSCISMMNICGIIVFFRAFMNIARFYISPYIPKFLWIAIVGILELTNGVSILSEFSAEAITFIVAAGMISFGGICVAIQAISVSSPGSGKYYLIGKSLQAVLSMILAGLYIRLKNLFLPVVILLLVAIKAITVVFKNYNQKTVAIRA